MKAIIGPYSNKSNKRKIKIKVHSYDLLNVDITLANLIVPVLKKFKKYQSGCHFVSNKDVPRNIKSNIDFDENKWNWLLDELIWTFTQIKNDKAYSDKILKRKENGLRLFGKYYTSIWI